TQPIIHGTGDEPKESTMIDRRSLLGGLATLPFLPSAACAALSGAPAPQASPALHTVPIPGTGRQVPVIGIGTARRYAAPQGEADLAPLRDTLARFAELGGQVVDTAPSYGRAEEVIGRLIEGLGVRDRLFLATKV